MQLIEYEVRNDWQEYEGRRSVQNNRSWRLILVLVIASMAAMLLIRAIRPDPAAGVILSILFSTTAYFAVPLAQIFRVETKKKWLTVLMPFILIGLGVFAGYLYPQSSTGSSVPPPYGAILIPFLGLGFMAWAVRMNPAIFQKWGFIHERRVLNLLIGVLVGGVIGLHFYFISSFFPRAIVQPASWLPKVLWYGLFLAGYAALGEELLLRGLCFHLLFDETKNNLSTAALQIAVLSMFMTFLPILPDGKPGLWAAFIFYRFAGSYLAVLLRYWRGSLFPGYTLQVVMQIMMLVVLR